ncbi:2-keto-4-pentenoate hydratase [Bhargavaea cecembensis]|uniref:2-keto-4-pentenoate hydratase n=1 Tax=Bhargavaea cecembensis TaxID=394098 RepID=A0A163FIC0_9BACL|nr:fumarylacetoacetate hydrolase family protein [Bhargavaea cecembensis]KZE38756.1 2-keto-4-pentenoate hydratase [Bhargavaea cecembensis]
MAIQIVRYEQEEKVRWGVLREGAIAPLKTTAANAVGLLEEGLQEEGPLVEIKDVKLLSPVVAPQQIICQGVNYGEHRAETGMAPKRPAFNMIFTKAESSVCGPEDAILRPEHVRLLDYEIELGLVLAKEVNANSVITAENLHEYIAGLVITNDVSARDVQLTQLQWHKGKSYRTFCPVGPYFTVLTEEEFGRLDDLRLTLKVNGEVRQQALVSQMLYNPLETLQELAQVMDLKPGALLMTGTPGGVAMNLKPEELATMTSLTASPEEKQQVIDRQLKQDRYLNDGDVIEATIATDDGAIDLGTQRNPVRSLVEVR